MTGLGRLYNERREKYEHERTYDELVHKVPYCDFINPHLWSIDWSELKTYKFKGADKTYEVTYMREELNGLLYDTFHMVEAHPFETWLFMMACCYDNLNGCFEEYLKKRKK